MTSRDFAYWLQGFFEISDITDLNKNQTQIVRNHLAMVFYHEIDQLYPQEQQEKLNELHSRRELD